MKRKHHWETNNYNTPIVWLLTIPCFGIQNITK